MRPLRAISPTEPAVAADVPVGIRRSTYLPELESLRGIAILLVYFFHTDGLLHFLVPDRPLPSLPLAFVRAGNTGVDLFFVLSGFLLTRPFVAEARGGRPVVLRDYFVRRALRILPLYWAAVVVVTLIAANDVHDLARGVPYLLFLNMAGAWPVMFPYSTVWWSLATELQFYAALPAARWILRPGSARRIAIGALLAYGVLYALGLVHAALHPPDEGSAWIWSSLYGRLPSFLFGVFGAWGYVLYGERVSARLHASRWMRNGGADALLVGVLFLMTPILREVVRVGFRHAEIAPFQVYHVATSALWMAFVGFVLVAPLRARPLLHNRVLAEVGVVSYSVYLWHVPVVQLSLMALRKRWPDEFHGWDWFSAVGVLAITVATFATAWVSYRVLERPFLLYKSRVGQ